MSELGEGCLEERRGREERVGVFEIHGNNSNYH